MNLDKQLYFNDLYKISLECAFLYSIQFLLKKYIFLRDLKTVSIAISYI